MEGKFSVIISKIDENNKIRRTYEYDVLCTEEYLNDKDELHRDGDEPACIGYFYGKNISHEKWYKNGKLHRDGDEPAWISYYGVSGNIFEKIWYQNGKKHRDGDKPAELVYESYYTYEIWYKDGNIHRDDDKPAYIKTNKKSIIITQEWYRNGDKYSKIYKPVSNESVLNESVNVKSL